MKTNRLNALKVRADFNLQSPRALYHIEGSEGDLQCTIDGSNWKWDLWQLRGSLMRRENRRNFSNRLHHADLCLEVWHKGRSIARIGRGVKGNLAARLLGLHHGEIYLGRLMH